MPFLSKNNPPSTSLHSGVVRPKSEPQRRGREGRRSPSASVSRSRSVPTRNIDKNYVEEETESDSSDDFIDLNKKKVKVQAKIEVKGHSQRSDDDDADEEDELPDPDELLQETDLNEWKLAQIEIIKIKFEGKLSDRNSTQMNQMTHNKIRKYLDEMDEVLKTTEIPKVMVHEDYVIRLEPPTDNEDFNQAIAKVEKQMRQRHDASVPLKCPFEGCATKFPFLIHGKRHIATVHCDMKLFRCTCSKRFTTIGKLNTHIRAIHLGKEYECNVCLVKYAVPNTVQKHSRLGHVMPEGQQVFSSPSLRQIEMRLFRPTDVTVSGGLTYQIFAIPWINENGTLVDVSVDLTRFENVKEAASILDKEITRACENGDNIERNRWVWACGSARKERKKGHRMRADLAFSLNVFGVSLVVGFQLKSFVRQYLDAVKIMATDESKYYLQDFNGHMKSTLNKIMDRCQPKPEITFS